MPISFPAAQKDLLAFVDRRHPAYETRCGHWAFCRATYEGGRDWFKDNIFRYMKEGDREFKDRILRAYRFNHTREVVHLVTKYIFKSEIIRNLDEAPAALKEFWSGVTVGGLPIDVFMQRVSDLASIYGRVWVVVDSLVKEGVTTRQDERESGSRIFAYTVTPEDALDYAFDEAGELLWIKFRILHRDDKDPIGSSGEIRKHYILWTRTSVAVLEETLQKRGMNEQRKIVVLRNEDHALGAVPVFHVDDRQSDDAFDVPALISDIAYLDRAVANYLSNLDAIIQDQAFSQLAMPGQAMMPGDDSYNKAVELGTRRVFIYDGDGGQPFYLSPDPKQAGVILSVINKIISEIYHTIGMAGERTKEDNAMGIDNSSGVAKAYDFERMNSLLVHKAGILDRAENRLAKIVLAWFSETLPKGSDGAEKDLVKYPESFDVRSLYDEFEIAQNLALLFAPETMRREQMAALYKKLFPRASEKLITAIEADLKKWPPEPVDAAALTGGAGGAANSGIGAKRRSRQGQVTDKTGSGQSTSSKKAG